MPRPTEHERRPARRLQVLAALALLVASACSGAPGESEPASGEPAAEPLNLILISIDTLRADRLGAYGYGRDTSPALDRLAAEGLLFETAVAPSSWTIPSHFSMLTGRMPTSHGVTLPPTTEPPVLRAPLLSSLLAGAGWHPFAITDGGWMSASMGFSPGFREFEDEPLGFAGVLERAREYIEILGEEGPYFAFLHTYDVHCPYEPAQPWSGRYRSPGAEELETEGHCGNPHYNSLELNPAQALYLSDRYDEGVREADAALGEFVEFLRERGELERTVIVVTSDHGEEFLEHGRIGHESTLYAESLLVPLIVRAPGLEPRRESAPVSLVDLVPTCLELLGLEPSGAFDGTSLLAPRPAESFVFSELDWNGRLRSWLGPDLHLIQNLETGERELFERSGDPAEQRDLSDERPEQVRELTAGLERFVSELATENSRAPNSPPGE